MDSSALTVFFEDPFWVGVFERVSGGILSACKVTFGAEPKDYEVYEFILTRYDCLVFGPGVEAGTALRHPGRRAARKQMEKSGIGTKSQQALQRQREQWKTERRESGRERRDAEKERLFALKQRKRKEKHRGH